MTGQNNTNGSGISGALWDDLISSILCEEIYNNNLATGDTEMTHDGCDSSTFMPTCTGLSGGWKRIANIDISRGDS